jgi:hypothetical protein
VYNAFIMPLHVDLKYANLISPHFEKFVRKSDYLFNVRCPICGDSQLKKTKMRGYIYRKKQRLSYKCHNCHDQRWLGALINHVAPHLYKEYLFETFKENNPTAHRMHKLLKEPGFFDTPQITNTETVRFGTVEQGIFQNAEKVSDLPDSHYCKEYVKGRRIPQEFWTKLYFTEDYLKFVSEIAPNHGKKLKSEPRLIIPYYDPFGALLAVSGRALDGSPQRYVTIRVVPGENKLIFGLERVDQSKVVYITEGPIDSLFLLNAVASGDANLILTAQSLSAAQIVLVFDNERRHPEVCAQMEKAIRQGLTVVVWPDWVTEKDVADMVRAGHLVMQIIKDNAFKGLTALTHFIRWKKTTNQRKGMWA